jgi:hypothetical protein
MRDDTDDDTIDVIEQPSTADTQNLAENEDQQGTPPQAKNEQDRVDMVPMERYKNAQALMTKATMEAADLRREVAALRTQLDNATRYAPQPQQQEIRGSDFQELEKLKEEYPDFAGPLVGAFEKQQQVIRELQRSNEVNEQASEAARRVNFNFEVSRAHPDFDQVAASEDFRGWLARQAPFVQDAASRPNPGDAIEVLNMYKKSAQGRGPDRVDRVAAAKQVAAPAVGRNSRQPTAEKPPQFTRESIARMTPAEFAKNEEAIEKALASGNIY